MNDIDPSHGRPASDETRGRLEVRGQPSMGTGDLGPGEALDADLRALRSVSSRNLPTLAETTQALYEHSLNTRGGTVMASMRHMRGRPWLTTAVAAGVMALALLVVPVSYNRTIGHEVLLTVAGPGLDDAAAGRIAGELQSALGAEDVTLAVEPGKHAGPKELSVPIVSVAETPATAAAATSPATPQAAPAGSASLLSGGPLPSAAAGPVYKFTARVPLESRPHLEGAVVPSPRPHVEAEAAAFAGILAERGLNAEATVSVWKEDVSGNVYAMAMDKAQEIRINLDGKTGEEVAAEIRTRLVEAGFSDALVNVSLDGEQVKISITACEDEAPCDDLPQIHLSMGDTDLEGLAGHKIMVRRTSDMTDEDVIAEVKRQLSEQGVDADVKIVDGRIQIEIRD